VATPLTSGEQTEAVEGQDSVPRDGEQSLSADSPDPSAAGAAPLKDRLDFLSETLLDLPTMLDELVKEGFISQRQAEDILIAPRTKKELSQHPLEIVADRGYENRKQPALLEYLSAAQGASGLRLEAAKAGSSRACCAARGAGRRAGQWATVP